jgi:hypothetical protein
MDAATATRRLRTVAGTLAVEGGRESTIAGVYGYLVGATYALLRSVEIGFIELQGANTQYVNELTVIAGALRDDVPLAADHAGGAGRIWLGGFYLNSALHRIAAAADRMDALPRRKGKDLDASVPQFVQDVYEEVNKLKHEPLGLPAGRAVDVACAIDALEYLTDRVAKHGA